MATSTALRSLLVSVTLCQTLSFQLSPSIRKNERAFAEKSSPLSAEFKSNEKGHEYVLELGDDALAQSNQPHMRLRYLLLTGSPCCSIATV
jgi:hypothetical protein